MRIHEIQFNEILKQIKDIEVDSRTKYINFDYDSGYISLSFSFCFDFGLFDSLGLFINNKDEKITDEQLSEIHKEIVFKTELIEQLKIEDKEIIRFGEVGF